MGDIKITDFILETLKFHPVFATVAQSVEQLIRNQQAAGSSPASSSNLKTLQFQHMQGFLM